ncbi:hypothetical protein [Pseudomonas juntendi]|uniref:Lipoprotein n=1 Tax=Pseudomonas juntendi TaxID=2666183 RepID=A0A7W2PW65_9PSED|nr:hypothetical protein [Pseudomonas juntendi]MBA6063082.1 hypothetical protein [Pseudomonas juntendi]MBA6129445.1 hypothetical protein [Pseudomonas juntendi]
MRVMVTILSFVLLGGCASMNEKRAAGPAFTANSSKRVDKVAECVLFAWQNQSLMGAHYAAALQPLAGGGNTVISAGEVEFADFDAANGKTQVRLYFQTGLMDWRKKRRIEAVESCL